MPKLRNDACDGLWLISGCCSCLCDESHRHPVFSLQQVPGFDPPTLNPWGCPDAPFLGWMILPCRRAPSCDVYDHLPLPCDVPQRVWGQQDSPLLSYILTFQLIQIKTAAPHPMSPLPIQEGPFLGSVVRYLWNSGYAKIVFDVGNSWGELGLGLVRVSAKMWSEVRPNFV